MVTAGHPTIPGVYNFRDVAISINSSSSLPASTPCLKPRTLYRSARLDACQPSDLVLLSLNTVFDLRTKTEHLLSPPPPPGSTPWTTQHINFISRRFELSLLLQLPWYYLLLCLFYLLVGLRLRAVRLLGEHVLAPKGLLGLTTETLVMAKPQVRQVFEVLADKERLPCLVHCTQGKDRTGVVVMLAAFLCGVGLEGVERDYCASEEGLREVRNEMRREVMEVGMGEGYLHAPDGLVKGVWEFLEERWGGVEGYLGSCGVSKETMERVRENLLA